MHARGQLRHEISAQPRVEQTQELVVIDDQHSDAGGARECKHYLCRKQRRFCLADFSAGGLDPELASECRTEPTRCRFEAASVEVERANAARAQTLLEHL